MSGPASGAGSQRPPRQAVILSGGGSNGAYEVGILKALLSGRCRGMLAVDPDDFFGTSIGSFNASFLVSQWGEYGPAAISNLERVWLERVAGTAGNNGVYRFRLDPAYYFAPPSYLPNPVQPFLALFRDSAYLAWDGVQRAVGLVSTTGEGVRERIAKIFDFSTFLSMEPWDRTIADSIRFASIRSENRKKLSVFATNWATGDLKTFENHDMTDQLGPLVIRASSSIPGIFPEVYIGAEPYVDGGVLMNTPLAPALDAGADILHVIYLDPDIAAIPLDTLNSTVAAAYRMQAIAWAALVNRDVDRVARINRGLAAFARLQRGEVIGVPEMDALAKGAVMVLGGARLSTYRPITVHRYHPRDDLSGGGLGLLNLDRSHIENLIDRGFADATLHDCVKAKCVLPDGAVPLAVRR